MDQHICYGSTKRRRSSDIKQSPVELLGTKTFCYPHYFNYRKQPSFSLHDFPLVSISRFKELLIREGKELKIRRNKKSRAALGQGPFPPLMYICSIFELFCRYWKPLWVKLMIWWWHAAHNHVDPREAGPKDWWYWLLLTSTPAHQKNVHELITPSLKNTIKLLYYLLHIGTHGFEDISLLWLPLSGKVIKLSFPTSPKTLFPRFNLVLM